MSSAGSRGLLWAPVDVLVRISADGRTPGDPVQGPSPGRLDYWALVWWSDGPLRRRDVVCRRAIAAPWWFWSGAPVGLEGRDRALRQEPMSEAGRPLGADRRSLGQPLARSAGREPWMAGYAEAWTGGPLRERRIRVRTCRQQGVLDGSRVNPGWPGVARRRGPGRDPLNPIHWRSGWTPYKTLATK